MNKSILLDEKYDRPTVLPVIFDDVWEMYKTHESAIWHAHEIKLDKDLDDWEKLDEDERYFLKHILAFFASSDTIISENLVENFIREVKMTEAKCFYGFQNMMENIHSEVYSNLLISYVRDQEECTRLLNAHENMDCVKLKRNWCKKWIESNNPFCERLVAFAIIEGVFFSGSFCSIYWMSEKQKLIGLCKANEFIARDEGLHTDFACLLYNKYIDKKMSQDRFEEILRDAVSLEINFITEALPCQLLGMNGNHMKKYVKFVANRLAIQLGHDSVYEEAEQPFSFMDRICLTEKSNFFEDDVGTYKKFDPKQKSIVKDDFWEDL